MIDWREVQATTIRAIDQFGGVHDVDIGRSADAILDGIRFEYMTRVWAEGAYAIGAWAQYDGATAAQHWARSAAYMNAAHEIDEMRRGWRDLDRWADDGGRS